MSKKLFERYTYSCYTSDQGATLRTGYHDWDNHKWLTNNHSFVRLNNPRIQVPRSKHPYCINFRDFMHNDLDIREIDVNLTLKYDSTIKGTFYFYHDGQRILLNNEMLGLMCKINDNNEFYFIQRGRYALYLYTQEKDKCGYAFQGLILGVRE